MSGLSLRNISKSFDDQAVLKEINLELAAGELVVVLGPSGCGKSTLLRIISGLESADSGEIFVSDKRIDQMEPKDRNIALVFQNYALYPHMTVEKNLSFPLRIAKVHRKEINEKVEAVAKLLGLSEKLNARPGKLSGGERQRVALGRAIIREPDIFLLDEPLSNLDADLRSRMRREIVALQRRIKKTVVHVTHDQTEALTMADKVVLMNKGQIVQVGTPRELYENPIDLFTAKFIGYPTINNFNSRNSHGELSIPGMNVDKLLTRTDLRDYVIAVRGEDIKIDNNGTMEGAVVSHEYLGGHNLIRINCNGIMLSALTQFQQFRIGSNVRFNISSNRLFLFDPVTEKRIQIEKP